MLRDSSIIIPAMAMLGCFEEPTASSASSASSAASTSSSDSGSTGVGVTASSASSADTSQTADEATTIGSDQGSGEVSTGASECVAPPDGIVAWWRGDGDFLDAVGPNHGTPTGGATLARDGMPGGALRFDGLDGAVLIGNDASLQFGLGDFTIEAWVRIDADEAPRGSSSTTPGDLTIAAKMSAADAANADGWRLFKQQQGEFWFCFGSDVNGCGEAESTTVRTPAGSPVAGTWSHLAAVHEGQQIRIYLDGALEDSRAMRAAVNTDAASLYLGASTSEPGDPPINAFFYGALDELALYARALTDDEIFALATSATGKCEP
ncbi:MAG: LamG domain-containing protein [Deltaproteobacteria bacterium]|nr:LamG domain-containing protein [Nannocystaceae bacterium]